MARASTTNLLYDQTSLSISERKYQTQMIMKLFALWDLNYKQQAIVLGLSPNTETSIHRYKTGKFHLPIHRDIQDRIQLLLTIHKYLRRIYPNNKELAHRWISTTNSDFDNLSPLQIICRDGFVGLVEIKNYLQRNSIA